MAATSLDAIRRIVIEAQSKGLDDVAAKLDKVAQAQAGLVASSTTVAKASSGVETAFKREQRALDVNQRAYEQYARSVKAVTDAQAQGLTSNQRATELLSLAETRLKKATDATTNFGKAAGPARHEWINLSRQLQDVGVSIMGGMSPLTVLAQQGSQISDVFMSSKAGIGDFAKTALTSAAGFLSAWGPAIAGVTLALGGLAAALQNVNEKREAMLAVSGGKGRLLGLNPDDIDAMASRSRPPGVSSGEAREGVLEGVRAGIAPETIEKINEVAKRYAATLNMELVPAQKELIQIFADPAAGIDTLEKKLTLNLTPALKDLIISMQAAGQTVQAQQLLFDAMTPTLLTNAQAVTANEQAWALLKTGASAVAGSFGDFAIKLITLNGIISQFIVSTAGIFQGLGQVATSAYAAVAGVDASTLSFGNAAAAGEALRRANELAFDTVNKANAAYERKAAVLNATTVVERAAATQAQVLGDLLAKGTNDIVANAEALRARNEVLANAARESQTTIRNQEIEIETNQKLISAYQMQGSNLAEIVARLKEEQAIRQAGLNVLDADSQKRIENAGTIARQTAQLEKAKGAAKEYNNEASRRAAMSGDERLAEDRKGGGGGGGGSEPKSTAVGFGAGWTDMDPNNPVRFETRISNANQAALRAQTGALEGATAATNNYAMAASAGADRTSAYNDRLQKLESATAGLNGIVHDAAGNFAGFSGMVQNKYGQWQGATDDATASTKKFSSALQGAAGAAAGRSFAAAATGKEGPANWMGFSNSPSSGIPLSQRGDFTSNFAIGNRGILEMRDAYNKEAEAQEKIADMVRGATRERQQAQISAASSQIQDLIQGLQDQRSALDENTQELEKATTARRAQLDKMIAKLEKALSPSRPDPYAERNPDYFYRFGTQAFKENDPMQKLLAEAEAERDTLDSQLEVQKKSAELQQKAIDEQIKGYQAQTRQLEHASRLLSAGVDLNAQEVAGIQTMIGILRGMADTESRWSDEARMSAVAGAATEKQIDEAIQQAPDQFHLSLVGVPTPKTGAYGFQKGIGGFFPGFFADGGYIPKGAWGIAGEAGPELISKARAVAGPAKVTPISGQPIVVNQTIVSQGGMRELRASRGELAQRSASEMRRSLRTAQ